MNWIRGVVYLFSNNILVVDMMWYDREGNVISIEKCFFKLKKSFFGIENKLGKGVKNLEKLINF